MLLGDPSRRPLRFVRLAPFFSFLGAACLVVACGDDADSPKAQPTVGVAGKGGDDGGGGSDGEEGGKGGTTSKGGAAGTGGKGGAAGTGGKGGASGTGGKGGAAGTGGAGGKAGGAGTTAGGAGGSSGGKAGSAGSSSGGAGKGGAFVFPDDCGTPAACSTAWEAKAVAKLDALKATPADLGAFLSAVPKGGDLHQHLSGSVYAETYLEWGQVDGNCINGSTFAATTKGQCSLATSEPIALSGPFFESTLKAWSMYEFDYTGAESGHDHFFATFGKFGTIAGAHRNESIADIAARAASENEQYIETMFNLGNNIGDLTVDIWMGTLTEEKLAGLYDQVIAHPDFQKELANDVKVVDDAAAKWRADLGCSGASPPAACDVQVKFVAQISRTQGKDKVFGQLISAFEMAAKTGNLVGANLSSAEDDTTSINNYKLHMQMIKFLREKYTATGKSPLHITLHAGELAPKFLTPAQQSALTFHIKEAVGVAGAERIGHGVDILKETDSADLLKEMHDKNVLVEVCLSSNIQILEVAGADHPLAAYRTAGVPVAFATDDQGVSRSSMAGEYYRAVTDQNMGYLALKRAVRNSLKYAFLPGDSLWATVADEGSTVNAACADEATTVVGDAPSEGCQAFLDGSEKARLQWELERRFRIFESQQ